MKLPGLRFRLAKNEPVANEYVPRDHESDGWRSISRSMRFTSKGEPFWGLPDNSTLAIEGSGSSFDLPVSLNGANPHAPRAPLIRIDSICKHDGNRDATPPANYGMSCKNEVFPEAG